MKTRDVKYDKSGLAVYYPGTDILMYRLDMSFFEKDMRYGLFKKGLLGIMRKASGLCAVVNESVINCHQGTAAMIDYINAGQPHGILDKMLLYGSLNAVKSRVTIIEQVVESLSQDILREKGSIDIFEAGCGFIRIPLSILSSFREGDNHSFYYFGVDTNHQVVETSAKIIEHEQLHGKLAVAGTDALESLEKSDRSFDIIIAEGVMEYWDRPYYTRFVRESYKHLYSGGAFIGTATHMIPKRRLAEFFLGTHIEPRSREEFKDIFLSGGFKEVELIQTTPPTMSIGIVKK
jgi:hypothetical protein